MRINWSRSVKSLKLTPITWVIYMSSLNPTSRNPMISTSTQLDVDHLLTPSEVIGSFEEETDETIPQNIDYRQSDKPYSSMPSRKHI